MPAGSPDPWAKALLACGSFALSLVVAEVGVRIIDPLPYFSRAEINNTEHGNLSQYDPLLGWRGVPNGAAEMVTENQRVWLQNNSQGFRDIEHDPHSQKPAIVFLGDSFAWGYDVEFDLIAASLVRRRLPDFEVFDLAHRGYGTDQSLLTFRQWQYDGPLRWVVLMFFENDVADNNALVRYKKPKPRFELIDGEMQLHGVPVPETGAWRDAAPPVEDRPWKGRIKRVFLSSHIVNHFYQLVWRPRRQTASSVQVTAAAGSQSGSDNVDGAPADPEHPYATTRWLLAALDQEVRQRGGILLVGFIPDRIEVEHLRRNSGREPNHVHVAEICRELNISTIEFAPALEASWLRVYYRFAGAHWNVRGHRIAADVIYERLRTLEAQP
jgi:hypothetical protein